MEYILGVRESMSQSCNMIITYMAPDAEFRVIDALKVGEGEFHMKNKNFRELMSIFR